MTNLALKPIGDLLRELDLFKIRRYGILVDESVDADLVGPLAGAPLVGFYTFGVDVADRRLHGRLIHLLNGPDAVPDVDGWILGTGSKACYALYDLLVRRQHGDRPILTLVTARFTPIFAYVDFFKGDTRTQVYIHHIFERVYKIPFPVPLRYVLRSHDGHVTEASQRMLLPNQTVVFDSDDFVLPEPFHGYLEFHADIRHLNGPVSAFVHMNCDYVSAESIATVHQSGYAPWPAGSRFGRGLMPAGAGRCLSVSMYNRSNLEPIRPRAELRCTLDGQRRFIVRALPDIPHGHMVFANLNEVFAPELERGATAADVVVIPDRPMHRPNFYQHAEPRTWSWESVEHSDGRVDEILPAKRRVALRSAGINAWVCPVPVLPDAAELDTVLCYLGGGVADLHDFRWRGYDEHGTCVIDTESTVGFGAIRNVSEWARTQTGHSLCRMVTLVPGSRAQSVPDSYQVMGGFQSRRHPAPPSTILAGVITANLPVVVTQAARWTHPTQHPMLPIVPTEIFGKARAGVDFDTTLVLYNVSPYDAYDREARIELDLVTWDGCSTRFSRTIAPNSSITLSVSDLLAEANLRSDRDYFTVWVACRDCFVYGYHIVRRRRDDALGIEHFYYGRFNTPE